MHKQNNYLPAIHLTLHFILLKIVDFGGKKSVLCIENGDFVNSV